MPIGEQLTTTTTTTQSDAYHNFVIHVRNAATRLNYVCKLNRFLKYCRLEEENNSYNGLLFDNDNKLIQSRITDFLIHIQAAGLSSATVRQYVTALRFFYEMNDITTLNWRKIGKTLSEYKKVANDRPYTRQEITKMLERTDQRGRIIILLMCSSGMRQGAIHLLKLGHLEKMQQEVYKITVYKNHKEEYITFCSPECVKYE